MIIIDLEDTAWICGSNEGGQLGLNENSLSNDSQNSKKNLPVSKSMNKLVKMGDFKAKDIALGASHVIIITMNPY